MRLPSKFLSLINEYAYFWTTATSDIQAIQAPQRSNRWTVMVLSSTDLPNFVNIRSNARKSHVLHGRASNTYTSKGSTWDANNNQPISGESKPPFKILLQRQLRFRSSQCCCFEFFLNLMSFFVEIAKYLKCPVSSRILPISFRSKFCFRSSTVYLHLKTLKTILSISENSAAFSSKNCIAFSGLQIKTKSSMLPRSFTSTLAVRTELHRDSTAYDCKTVCKTRHRVTLDYTLVIGKE